ncbi:MAG TPA: ATP-binding protein, partial [Marmoricola sp.]
ENAVRHGDGIVRVDVRTDADDAVIGVSDEGEGIPDAIRARVFTKFWRHGSSGGSGLGMYIVNGLTRAHGGSVSIGDADGGGARIEVRWPLARD